MIDYSSVISLIISYLESLVPGLVFGALTGLWYLSIDQPRLGNRNWIRLGPIPITHHPLEAVSFFLFGYAFGSDGLPPFFLLYILVLVPIVSYPLVRRLRSRSKSKDPMWLIATTFLVLEVFLTLGYFFGF